MHEITIYAVVNLNNQRNCIRIFQGKFHDTNANINEVVFS